VIQTVSALAIVLALIALLRLGLRMGGVGPPPARRRSLRVLESAALGSKQRLHVVEVDGERLLIGATEGSVRLLHQLPPRPAGSEAEGEAAGPAAAAPRALLRLLSRSAPLWLLALFLPAAAAQAAGSPPGPELTLSLGGAAEPERLSSTLQIVALLTLVSVAPSILLMATCFTRILVVLSLLRQATGIQQLPPNQVLVGLSLFTTLFVMAPIGEQVQAQALAPYMERKIDEREALARTLVPVRSFLLRHTRENDLELFVSLSSAPRPATPSDTGITTLLPAFMISELRTAFEIGFMIYLPFLVIDIVIASMLISMGMIVLPPVMISLPFKVMLFVLLDGWNLVLNALVKGLV
jgi:flagellar biosynthetic protein FliP